MIRAVCFDMDGVLFDTERLGTEVMQAAAGLQGFQFTQAQWMSLIGQNMEATKASIAGWFQGKMDGEQFIADWCRLMLKTVEEKGMPEKPGARQALAMLKARGLHLALVTSNDPAVVDNYLRRTGFDVFFDQIVTGNMTQRGKPAPDIYLKAAELLGVAPSDCVGVEDSANGVKAIRGAGMRCVMVPDILPYSEALAPYVDDCLTSLHELEATLFG